MNDYADPTPIATTEDFKKALLAVRDDGGMRGNSLQLLNAHFQAKNHTITATKLAASLEMTSYVVANSNFGKLAHAIADKLGYRPWTRTNGTTGWWFTLAYGRDGQPETDEEHFQWIMRPELVAALREMRWVKS